MRLTTLLITLTLFSACREKQSRNLQLQEQTVTGDRVEVIYFHGKQRCMTCKSIEAQTKELLTGSLAEAVKTGQIVYRTVDISDKEGEKIADRYEVTWSSLFAESCFDKLCPKYPDNIIRAVYSGVSLRLHQYREFHRHNTDGRS